MALVAGARSVFEFEDFRPRRWYPLRGYLLHRRWPLAEWTELPRAALVNAGKFVGDRVLAFTDEAAAGKRYVLDPEDVWLEPGEPPPRL
ncbi:MAG: hypothetical protein L0216_01530 [Planctomycetales bacterium]|nr:hypothetical protein [Planctomycetales bacterium]